MKGIHIATLAMLCTLPTSACNKATQNEAAKDESAAVEPVAKEVAVAASPPPETASEKGKKRDDERWITVEETELYRVVDEVSERLADATDEMLKDDDQAAAESLRLAARALVAEAEGLDSSVYDKLKEPAHQLESVADALDRGDEDLQAFNDAVSAAYDADIMQRWVVLDDVQRLSFFEQPDVHFAKAEDALVQNKKEAAKELAKVASYVRLQALAATGPAQDRLEHAIDSIEQLQRKLDAGKAVDIDDLNDVRFETSHALAYFHYHRLVDKGSKRSPSAWRAALHHLQAALLLTPAADKRLLDDVQHWADDLKETIVDEEATLDKHLESLNRALSDLDKDLDDKTTSTHHAQRSTP